MLLAASLSHHPHPAGDGPHSHIPSSLKTAVSVDLPVMNISYKWNYMTWLFYIVSSIFQDICDASPYRTMHRCFAPFDGWITLQ